MGRLKLANTKSKLLLPLLSIVVFAGLGAWLVFVTKADSPQEPYYDYDAHINWQGAFDPNTVTVGQILNVPVGLRFSNPLYTQASQMRLIIFSDSERVDFMGYTCNAAIRCYESTWDKHDADVGGRKDARICVSVPPPPITGYHLGQHGYFVTLQYKMKDPVRAFWVELDHASGPGSCESNPNAAGVIVQGGYGSCVNYTNHVRNCSGTDGAGIGYLGGGSGGFSGGVVGIELGEKDNGTGTSGNNKSHNSGGSAGGASGNKQAEQPNTIPASASQGNNQQPDLKPSPFFDGKEFKSGSDTDTFGDTVTTTSKKLLYSWQVVLGVIVLGGVVGYGLWRWRHKE